MYAGFIFNGFTIVITLILTISTGLEMNSCTKTFVNLFIPCCKINFESMQRFFWKGLITAKYKLWPAIAKKVNYYRTMFKIFNSIGSKADHLQDSNWLSYYYILKKPLSFITQRVLDIQLKNDANIFQPSNFSTQFAN